MKGLYRYLSPFAPDQSGAVSVLYELGGIIVICDAGGCAGNICGFDEPRWFTHKSAVFSAGLRDMDAIMGRDDKLMTKIGDAVASLDCKFIALIGTPVPSVIGTDFKALAHIAQKRFGLPVLTVETTGMDLYDRGQEKAYMSLFKTFSAQTADQPCDPVPKIGIIGATPLDLFNLNDSLRITRQIEQMGFGRAVCYGMDSGLENIRNAGAVRCNVVVSPSGLKAAKWLKEQYGTPYVAGIPLTEGGAQELKIKIADALSDSEESKDITLSKENTDKHTEGLEAIALKDNNSSGIDASGNADISASDTAIAADSLSDKDAGILILHQQFIANELRKELYRMNYSGRIDVASWFMLDESLIQNGDTSLHEENDLSDLLKQHPYKAVAGDPLFQRAIAGWEGTYINLPHYPVSSGIYGNIDTDQILQQLIHAAS